MKRVYKILFLSLITLISCEDIYYADLDTGNNLLVVEAIVMAGSGTHYVKIGHTTGFYEDEIYQPVSGANVYLIDNNNNILSFNSFIPGGYYNNNTINPDLQYKLQIHYEDEIYESPFESVPDIPDIDTVYGDLITKKYIVSDISGNSVIKDEKGVQVYIDIKNNDDAKYYRFDARKVLLSTFPFDTVINFLPVTSIKYAWRSIYPQGSYNIASPRKYSSENNINKHPVEFFKSKNPGYMYNDEEEKERGWIYIIHQYSLPVSGFRFYEELNKQLESDGKIFDPMYSQTFGNLKCITNKKNLILGNFELNNYMEHRYFISISINEKDFKLKKINSFYEIPRRGVKSIYEPDFWMR